MQLKREEVERVARAGGEPAVTLALALFEQVGDLAGRVEALERRLGRNSRNSSMPPSSDRPRREDKSDKGGKGGKDVVVQGVSWS